MTDTSRLLNLDEFERAAAATLPTMAFDYYAGGAADEVTLRGTRAAWDHVGIRYRVLRGIAERSVATTVLGQELAVPILAAPMAFQRLAHPDGEVALMRAAGAAGAGMVLSTLSTTSLEEVRAASEAPLWFQLYIYKDRDASKALVQRAEAAGCTALVLTVDSPILGRREREARSGFHLPAEFPVPNLEGLARSTLASSLHSFIAENWDADITWDDLAWLQSITELPILVKGIVRGDDARLALENGAAGVIVSNHGGRQLDTAVQSVRALSEVAQAMDGEGTLLVDGGIRRGTDIVKAMALGAHAVLLGRPLLWGLAVDGEAGARRVFELLRDEFDVAMGLSGCASVDEITLDLLD
ncbi:MAG: alpha-hydroxy-acid oxidizing protein [Gemmatimonadetes bacterium]|nr:alpha-hydroxy-acid oxidizing protein [Gemmatimonadota bacterium]